ncbi:putative reverse transcriptase domain-containing protein [Tanacetum coccineum]
MNVAPEIDVASEATVGTSTQKPYAIRDLFPSAGMLYGSQSQHVDSHINGMAPWAFDTLFRSKNKIREKERELLDHDLGDVERTLGNVLEMLKVLEKDVLHESLVVEYDFLLDMVRIGADPKPPSDDKDNERPRKNRRNLLRWDRWNFRANCNHQIMPPKAMSEARMREVIREQVATSMAEFMANMNREAGGDEAGGAGAGGAGAGGAGAGGAGAGGAGAGGAGAGGARPAAPEITGCTYVTFMKCDPQPFKGTEGAVGLCQWFEKLESVFRISDCKERDKVKFATATLQGHALTWWNGRIASMGIDAANGTDIDGYTNRFHELALLCPRMVEPEQVKVEQYIRGLSKNIRGDVTSSRPAGIDEAVRMAYQLMGKIIRDKTDEVSKGEKRKGEGDRGGRGDNRRDYNRRQNQRRDNAGAMTNVAPNDNEVCPRCKNKKHAGDYWKCGKCGKLGRKTAACRCLDRKDMTCLNCNEKGHLKRDCPKLKKNGQGGNNRGAVYKLGVVDAQQDLKVVTGTFLLNNRYATALFDLGADKSFMSTNFSTLIDIEPVELDTCYDVELADGKVVSTNNVLIGCTLNLLNRSFLIDLMVIELGSFDIIIGMDWLSRYDAAILCGEKKVRIPLEGKTLVIEGDLQWDDDILYKFKEGDFHRLRIQDIEYMLLLLVQGKLTNLNVEERLAFNVSLRMFTKSVVIQRRVEDLQLGVESYQKELNLIKPDTYISNLRRRDAYTPYSDPRGFNYQNKDKKNRLMRIDELHKFSDGTLGDVRTALNDRLKGI